MKNAITNKNRTHASWPGRMNVKLRLAMVAMGLILSLAAVSASAKLIATPGSGQAGTDFAALNSAVQSSGISIQYVTGNDTPVNVGDTTLWLDDDAWNRAEIYNVWPKQYNWHVAVVFDFGRPVTVSRIEAMWSKYNDNAVVPDIYYIADALPPLVSPYFSSVSNASFAATSGVAPGTWAPLQITDTFGTLANPVTMSKLYLVMYSPGADEYTRPAVPSEFNIYGSTAPGIMAVPTWYDNLDAGNLSDLATDGCKQVVVYAVGGSSVPPAEDHFLNGELAYYLDTADYYGIKVIVSVKWIVEAGDMSGLTTDAATFASYPALAGWYILDEPPANNSWLISQAESAQDILKAATPYLPTYMAFMLYQWQVPGGLDIPVQYADAYDVLMWDCYSLYRDDGWGTPPTYYPEWVDVTDWRDSFNSMKSVADSLGKPFMPVLQGYGATLLAGANKGVLRLPSKAEERFMMYYSVNNGARDMAFWEYTWLLDSEATVAPNPYLGTGVAWRTDVGEPVMDELMLYAAAIDCGPVASAVSGWGSGINGKLYRNPSSGKYYLLTVNNSASASAAFTLTISLPGNWSHLAEYGAGTFNIVGNTVSLSSYAKYQVRNFELVPGSTSTMFLDGFESGNFTAGGWTNSGCTLQTTYKYAGTRAAQFNSSDSLTKSLSTASYQNIQVQYARYTRNCTSSCHFIAEWYDGSSWTTLENVAGNSSWTAKTFDLPAGANNKSGFKVRFRTSGNSSTRYGYLDEVKVIGQFIQ